MHELLDHSGEEAADMVVSSFSLTKVGLVPLGTPTFEEWKECGVFLSRMESSVHFCIGDWLTYGEQEWGSMYEQAIKETGFDYQTLRNDKWVCSRVQLSRRRDNLSYEHHKEVASFPPHEQELLLRLAEQERMPLSQFRREKYQLLNKGTGTPQIEETEQTETEHEGASEQTDELPAAPAPLSLLPSDVTEPVSVSVLQQVETPQSFANPSPQPQPVNEAPMRTPVDEVPLRTPEQNIVLPANTDTILLAQAVPLRQVERNRLYHGEVMTVLETFPDVCIDMVITSPPYWGLRDFGMEEQLGLEPTIAAYIDKLCQVFDEIKRVLKPTGSCWVNLGDSYSNSSVAPDHRFDTQKSHLTPITSGRGGQKGYPEKSLALIPFRFAIEMVARGWILRNTVIWHKPNAMPESVTDRFTTDFEYLFFFTKESHYYFEQQFEEPISVPKSSWEAYEQAKGKNRSAPGDVTEQGVRRLTGHLTHPNGRNMRSVWTIPTQASPVAHFATYPEKLCVTPIQAGCPAAVCPQCGKPREIIIETPSLPTTGSYQGKWADEDTQSSGARMQANQKKWREYTGQHDFVVPRVYSGYTTCDCHAGWLPGIVLDPFIGTGTSALVAKKLGRDYVGIELNAAYVRMAEERLARISEGQSEPEEKAG